MSVIANLDINLRGNTASLDSALGKSSQGVATFASGVSGQVGGLSARLAGLGTGFGALGAKVAALSSGIKDRLGGMLSDVPNGGSLSKILGAVAQPLTSVKQLALGAFNTLAGIFTLNPVQLLKGLGDLSSLIGNLTKSAVALGAAFFAMGMANIGGIADLNKASMKLGISTEQLSAYLHVSRLDIDELSGVMVKLEKNLVGAGEGSKEAAAAFAKLGINTQDLLHGSPDEMLAQIADGFQGIGTQAERVALSLQLFGKSGASMLKLLGGGSEGLKKGLEEAGALGMVVSQAQAQQVAAAKGAMTTMKEAFTGLGRTAAIAIAPFVEMFAKAITEGVKWLMQFREPLLKWFAEVQFTFENFGEVVSIQFDRALWKVTSWANEFIHIFTDVLPQVLASFGELLYDGLTSGFKDGFDAAFQKAMKDIEKSLHREEGAIEKSLREGFEARQKGLTARWEKFWEDKQKASPILPAAKEGIDATGIHKNAAAERGSKEAFEIIAGAQGDKMYAAMNESIRVQREQLKELQELRRKKAKGLAVAKL